MVHKIRLRFCQHIKFIFQFIFRSHVRHVILKSIRNLRNAEFISYEDEAFISYVTQIYRSKGKMLCIVDVLPYKIKTIWVIQTICLHLFTHLLFLTKPFSKHIFCFDFVEQKMYTSCIMLWTLVQTTCIQLGSTVMFTRAFLSVITNAPAHRYSSLNISILVLWYKFVFMCLCLSLSIAVTSDSCSRNSTDILYSSVHYHLVDLPHVYTCV